ncbi:glutamate--cysteine ligase [Streptomyces sp. NPDC029674]|uniref:carboxylate-amine ligase n=1 Tax=Streptomyces sp. NPDC029674 TaxID=3365297 RepID=UPI003850A0AE
MLTVGVEEEYLLLDPVTGLPVPRAEEVRAAAGLGPFAEEREMQSELLQAQVEVATPVCTELKEVSGHLLRLRLALAAAAESAGCRIAACAAAPRRALAPVPVTDEARYRAIHAQAPQLVEEQLINGMHVHVAVPTPEVGVAVLNRIRMWLPVLSAMSANSPLWDGHDTGFASWRTVVFGRWPVSGPPPRFADLADFEDRVQRLLSSGVIQDIGQLYWQARPSGRYPTVEVRCLDVQLRVDEAVMLTGIVRGLVTTAVTDIKNGVEEPDCLPELLQASHWQAARHGLSGFLLDPAEGRLSAGDAVARLMDHIEPALDATGDLRQVTSLVHRLLREGTPADRQRHAFAEGGMAAVTALITGETAAP